MKREVWSNQGTQACIKTSGVKMEKNTGEQLVRTHEGNKSSQQMCNYYADNDNTIRISAHKNTIWNCAHKIPKRSQ